VAVVGRKLVPYESTDVHPEGKVTFTNEFLEIETAPKINFKIVTNCTKRQWLIDENNLKQIY
jgi:hypothetical protein